MTIDNPASNTVLNHGAGRALWVDYLRSFITVLVVAHHSTLAYTTFARLNPHAYILSTHPIIDSKRWIGLDIFENFNDVFFMALMFLIGGFFVVKGLKKKGPALFIRDRFYRLFLPFVVAVCSLMLLAYYPAYLTVHPEGGLENFLKDFIFVEGWPPGPAWFIWVLFLFNLIFAVFGKAFLPFVYKAENKLQALADHPVKVAFMIYIIIWLLYVPASWIFGAYTWTGFGPFAFQKSRLLLYFGFFIFGSIIGASDIEKGLFSSESGFIKYWRVWLRACVIFYMLLLVLEALGGQGFGRKLGEWPSKIIYGSVYAGSTCFSSIAFLTLFRKFTKRAGSFRDSLTRNAYCIYLVHYIFVLWCQYELLNVELPAFIKFLITFLISMVISWQVSILLRKIPVVKKYV
ncbi:MAG TPA: acyltransferase [Puia sp.]|nr:acyltransferase [Puia sp.]